MCDEDYGTAHAPVRHAVCVCGFPAEIMCALLQYVEIMPGPARRFYECSACTICTICPPMCQCQCVCHASLHARSYCKQSDNSLPVYQLKIFKKNVDACNCIAMAVQWHCNGIALHCICIGVVLHCTGVVLQKHCTGMQWYCMVCTAYNAIAMPLHGAWV